jgi:DNA-directed RNA polymerase specialized sigma24 family protein
VTPIDSVQWREPSTDNDDPLLQMARAVVARPRQVEPDVFHAGMAALRAYLQRRYTPSLLPTDVEEITAEAVAQLYHAAVRGLIDNHGNPTGYLLKITINLARARLARTSREAVLTPTLTDLVLTDDEAASRLDRVATADMVQRAMAAARMDGDATAFKVGTYMLDAIQRTGTVPGSRHVGQALGISHTAVAKALARLRRYIDNAVSP